MNPIMETPILLTLETLLSAADTEMYRVKNQKKIIEARQP
jgi:hypothetical protein